LGQRGSLAKLLSSTKAFFAKHLRGVSP
jgi:hypothetical protein